MVNIGLCKGICKGKVRVMKKKEITCIVCPVGCKVEAELGAGAEGTEIKISGNKCKRGYEYAYKECTMPMRILTTTVAISNGELPVLPVKTDAEIPKDKIIECMKAIRNIKVNAPVYIGDIICKNILETGANIIATRTILEDRSRYC